MNKPRTEAGYIGVFTRDQAEGALPNGTKIVKTNSVPGDTHVDGSGATILGSVVDPSGSAPYAYFVEWDDAPRYACLIVSTRVSVPS